MNDKIALISGEGLLPVEIAKKLKSLNYSTLIFSLSGENEQIKPYAEKFISLRYPNLGRGVREIKNFGAEKLIMAGRIPKNTIYSLPLILFFDKLSRSVLKKTLRDDHSLLGSIVEAFESENIKVIPYWQILPEFIAPKGKLTKRSPTKKEFQDIEYGEKILHVTLPCSFGQSICVADGAVVAVEAMEGTDRMIKRSGELSGHGTVIKMMKENQDMRYDLPTVGTKTLDNMKEAGLTCLAVESGKTLILEPEKFFNLAEKFNIAVWGI
ncbi:MAG: UDP-2,3-diacylglucosamine diphosphatase LpxI [Synergistaceae bacterium]|nr:UDP-2,3-diacylglucosamine diphosphatase LpxI [Synergistaceae bacterium]